MIVLGLDLEATGLDKVKDRPIEVGITLWSTNMQRGLDSRSFLIQSEGVTVTDEITEITGITPAAVARFGYEPDEAFDIVMDYIPQAEAIVAFNGRHFDVPMFHQWAKRLGKTFPDVHVIDLFEDMPKTSKSASPGMRGQELITMCAKHGIYYDPHEAGADVSAMLRLMGKRPFDLVLERSHSDTVIVQSLQSQSNNHLAKKHKFRWAPKPLGIWWKKVKRIDLNELVQAVNGDFDLVERDIPLDVLESND